MNRLIRKALSSHSSQRGVTLVEYALIIGVVSLAAIAALSFFGQAVSDEFLSGAQSLNTGPGNTEESENFFGEGGATEYSFGNGGNHCPDPETECGMGFPGGEKSTSEIQELITE